MLNIKFCGFIHPSNGDHCSFMYSCTSIEILKMMCLDCSTNNVCIYKIFTLYVPCISVTNYSAAPTRLPIWVSPVHSNLWKNWAIKMAWRLSTLKEGCVSWMAPMRSDTPQNYSSSATGMSPLWVDRQLYIWVYSVWCSTPEMIEGFLSND